MLLTRGLGASPGAAVGPVVFRAVDAIAAAERGRPAILVRHETDTEDVAGMMASVGVLTSRGGLVSHAAVVARGWGKPAVVGAEEIEIDGSAMRVGSTVVVEGEVISLDGATGEVFLGSSGLLEAELPPEFDTVLAWADEIRGRTLSVRANADTGADAEIARRMGAEGIGLCRTEHMFLRPDRLGVVRRMILAQDPDEEAQAIDELRRVQRSDFTEVLEAMDGAPVTVRLLDPPLHEFLPRPEAVGGSAAAEAHTAAESGSDGDGVVDRTTAALQQWTEVNPMLGIRGVRLAVLKPSLYAMQVGALLDAVADRTEVGGTPIVEVMIPLTVAPSEMVAARGWVDTAVGEVGFGVVPAVGTMIETPRAALLADEMAAVSDFFSFGTNDLTQMTFGFSRDDVEAVMVPAYLARGLLEADPFDTIDTVGVGALVADAVRKGRAVRPDLTVGVCGEHGGDPASISFFVEAGVDYVSCSPYRVPIARLAAAHAVLNGSGARGASV
ncbi:MAG: putative PEP-binding protein [Microthrixaceae bacterium]